MRIRKSFYKRLAEVIFDTDLVGVRLTLFLGEVFWAIGFIWPGETTARPIYDVVSRVGGDAFWAFVFMMSAATQITIIMQDDLHSCFARYFAGWNATLWSFCCISALFSVYPPPAAMGGETALALAAIWIWIRPYILEYGEKKIGDGRDQLRQTQD